MEKYKTILKKTSKAKLFPCNIVYKIRRLCVFNKVIKKITFFFIDAHRALNVEKFQMKKGTFKARSRLCACQYSGEIYQAQKFVKSTNFKYAIPAVHIKRASVRYEK